MSQDKRQTACARVALTVMCIFSENKTRACLMGPEQDPRRVKRATGAYNRVFNLGRCEPATTRTPVFFYGCAEKEPLRVDLPVGS
eukprot:1377287-Prymnesium_polylepis.1